MLIRFLEIQVLEVCLIPFPDHKRHPLAGCVYGSDLGVRIADTFVVFKFEMIELGTPRFLHCAKMYIVFNQYIIDTG